MHEITIIKCLLDIIDKKKEEHNFKKVKFIGIVCGKYNCASEENLVFCYNTLAEAPYLKGARLKLRRLTEKYHCMGCKNEFFEGPEIGGKMICPKCKTGDVVNKPNSEIYIDVLEVD